MKLEEIISVTGLPGLYTVATNRTNGLIVEDIETGKRRFASSRKHQFVPLESIAIYTDDGEAVQLSKVLRSMHEQLADNPPVAADASNEDLFEYLADVLPTYDSDRVHASDVRRLIKWFTLLQGQHLLDEAASTEEE